MEWCWPYPGRACGLTEIAAAGTGSEACRGRLNSCPCLLGKKVSAFVQRGPRSATQAGTSMCAPGGLVSGASTKGNEA
eukprot:1158027-Pelagomonas_calceolata.AAC.12